MLTDRPLTLKARDRKPLDLGPKVRVELARQSPGPDGAGLAALINGAGLRDGDKDGLREHDATAKNMWQADGATNLTLELELPEPVALGAIEVWNYNAPWLTSNGVRQADIAVSADGTTWKTVVRAAKFSEADGRPDYDEPIVVKLPAEKARKVRFENIVAWGGPKVGLSEVVFHQAAGPQAGPAQPEDGAVGVLVPRGAFDWVAGQGASEHRVLLGASRDSLAAVGTAKSPHLDGLVLKPDTTYYWRVDEVQPDGAVVTGRVAQFETTGLVAWWKLDETEGTKAADATGHGLGGNISGKPQWAPGQGRIGGALEFDGKQTFVNAGRAPELDFRDGMTVAAWIKVREFNKPYQAIVTRGDHTWRLQRNREEGTVMFVTADGSKVAQGVAKDRPRLLSKRAVDDGQWHHLVGVYDGQRAALYVDGELQDSIAVSGPLAVDSQPVMLGCNSAAYERRFNGWLDDVRLYGYGLSDEEVKTLYRGAGAGERAAK